MAFWSAAAAPETIARIYRPPPVDLARVRESVRRPCGAADVKLRPRDQIEAMLTTQMEAVHVASIYWPARSPLNAGTKVTVGPAQVQSSWTWSASAG